MVHGVAWGDTPSSAPRHDRRRHAHHRPLRPRLPKATASPPSISSSPEPSPIRWPPTAAPATAAGRHHGRPMFPDGTARRSRPMRVRRPHAWAMPRFTRLGHAIRRATGPYSWPRDRAQWMGAMQWAMRQGPTAQPDRPPPRADRPRPLLNPSATRHPATAGAGQAPGPAADAGEFRGRFAARRARAGRRRRGRRSRRPEHGRGGTHPRTGDTDRDRECRTRRIRSFAYASGERSDPIGTCAPGGRRKGPG